MGQSCHRPFAPAAPLGRLLALPGQAPDLITSRSHLTCLLSREDFSAAQTESGLRALRPRLSAVSPPSRAHGNSSVITGLPCRPGGHEGRAASPSDRRPRAGRCPWPAGAASKQPGNRDRSPCNNSVRTGTTAALGKPGKWGLRARSGPSRGGDPGAPRAREARAEGHCQHSLCPCARRRRRPRGPGEVGPSPADLTGPGPLFPRLRGKTSDSRALFGSEVR